MDTQWKEALERVRGGAMGDEERADLARALMEAFRTGQIIECAPVVRDLLRSLGTDGYWSVRKAVVNELEWVHDRVADELLLALGTDCNAYVRRTAARCIRRRKKQRRQAEKRQRSQKRMGKRLAQLTKAHGEEVARKIVELSDLRYTALAGSMAHDLRSLLSQLNPLANRIVTGIRTGTDVAVLQRKAARLMELVDLLDRCVADMERYTEPPTAERHPEDLAELVGVACQMAQRNIEDLGFDPQSVVLRTELPAGPRVRVSRHMLILAIANLVKNAYESFMAGRQRLRRGEVTVSATYSPDAVRIAIRDNGMGISSDNLPELRCGIPARRNMAKRRSTGFGIPIARRYVQAHGGTLDFASEEDAGTTATITLPARPPAQEEDEE